MPRGFDLAAAHVHLASADPALVTGIARVEPVRADPRWRRGFDVVDALARAILYQQLSGKAAATIVGRVEIAIGSALLDARSLGAANDEALRSCGVSRNKLLALRDLCAHALRGEVPDLRRMARMTDAEVIEALLPVRGIGRWTIEMLLIFRLGRPDVLPLDDLGVRRGLQFVDGLGALPTPRELAARGECWGPYRSLASMYLWRIADTCTPQ